MATKIVLNKKNANDEFGFLSIQFLTMVKIKNSLGIRILINDFNDHFNSDFNSFNHRENKFKGKLNTITEP